MTSTMDESSKITHPPIPYAANIPQGLSPGKSILIRGTVIDSEYKRFSIDLCCGRLVQGDHRDDVALHINPRFNLKSSLFGKADNQIVLNTLENNVWMIEHRCANTLHVGKPFSLRILVLRDYYKITLNGMLLADFVHRIPVDRVKSLYIDGCVSVEHIEFQGTNDQPSAPTPNSDNFQPKDYHKPAVPFVLSTIGEGFLPPRELRISASPRMSATRFEINLMLENSEYLFHFRVDMPSREIPQGFIVRNSTENGKWLQNKEERDIPFFPFKTGHTADIVFVAKETNCEVNVDGRPICVFNYRQGHPKNVKSIQILGDVILQSVHLL